MNKYTPGPWRVVKDPTNLSLQVYGQTLALFECWRRSDEQTELANARLAAAAPELLEALVALLDVSEELCGLGIKEMIKAHEVIKKATGGNE